MFGGGGISHVGHLGGVLMGWIYMQRKSEAGGQALSIKSMMYRFKRYRMRQKLRAVRYEEWERNRRSDDDRRLH
jgi:hypothetical protein